MPPPTFIPSHPGLPTPVRTHDTLQTQNAQQQQQQQQQQQPALTIPIEAWRAKIPADLPITSITSLSESDKLPPTLSEKEVLDIKSWMEKDREMIEGKKKGNARGKMMNWAKGSDMATPWWMVRKGENYEVRGGGGGGGRKWIGLEQKREWRMGRKGGERGQRFEIRL
jgi:hypothetical protein